MINLTLSTTGTAPNAAGNPSEALKIEAVELRRFFEPDAEVVTLTMTPDQAVEAIEDLIAQVWPDDHVVLYSP